MAEVFRAGLLEGKNAFVTGGGSGINFGIVQRFAEMGAKVTIIGRTQEKLDKAVAELQEAGGTALGISADVRDYDAVDAALQQAQETHGELDILVCGAAGNFPAPAVGMSHRGFKSVVDIDLLGTFNACRAAFDRLRKPGASVINISATQAWIPTPFQVHVCAAKAGIDQVTRVLAAEWGPLGIRVNSIAPGPVAGTEGMRRLTPSDEARARLVETIPLRRYAEKREIADLALFLCSPAATYITGAVLTCDGGQSLMGSGIMLESVMGG